jgi:hypothetical protein
VQPGEPGAGEQHDFIGNRSTDAFSKRRTIVGARTSCDLSADTSAYWIPTLLDDAGDPVPIIRVLVYYLAAEDMVVQPFPRNLKIITGGDTTDPPAPSRSQNVPALGVRRYRSVHCVTTELHGNRLECDGARAFP